MDMEERGQATGTTRWSAAGSQTSPRIANPDMGGMLTGEFVPDALHEHKEEEDEGPAMEYNQQQRGDIDGHGTPIIAPA